MDPSRGEQQGHPVIRTLYDHMEEVTCLEFHPKEPVLVSGSRDNTIKMFDISKASVKKAFKTITVNKLYAQPFSVFRHLFIFRKRNL